MILLCKKIYLRGWHFQTKYFISIQTEVLDGRIFISGKVDDPEEKIKITKMAWETKGVRSVKNTIIIKGQTNFKTLQKIF